MKNGDHATLPTRWYPISDNTLEAMKTANDTMPCNNSVKAFGKTVEDVSGLDKVVTWVPGINKLNVLGMDRIIVLTISSVPKAGA